MDHQSRHPLVSGNPLAMIASIAVLPASSASMTPTASLSSGLLVLPPRSAGGI
jgi:hypothetical protein